MLLDFANLTFILALEADESMKQTFFPTFAIDAISKKCYGKAKVVISIQKARFSTTIDRNLHFLISASKFDPNFAANRMAPSCPAPSFKTHYTAAEAIFAYVVVLTKDKKIWSKIEMKVTYPPNATNKLYVLRKPMAVKETEPINET